MLGGAGKLGMDTPLAGGSGYRRIVHRMDQSASQGVLESAIGTLSVLDLLDETEEPGESICRITGSLLSLLSDALSLFEAEYARRHR